MQRLVRALEVHEARGTLAKSAVAQAAERDRAYDEHAHADRDADDQRQVCADARGGGVAARVPRLRVPAHLDEVRLHLGRIVRRRQQLDERVRGLVDLAVDEVTIVDKEIDVAHYMAC